MNTNDFDRPQRRYDALLKSTTSVIWTMDRNFNFVDFQPAWHRYTGQDWRKQQGKGWLAALHPDDRATALDRCNEAIGRSSQFRAEGRVWQASSDNYHPFVADVVPVTNESGVVVEWVAVFNDVFEQESAAAFATEASLAKTEFLTNMSHEIRTPMAAILGYADVLAGHLKDPDNNACVQVIKKHGQFLLEIIDDILDLSRIEAGKLQVKSARCDLPGLIADIRSLMQVRADAKNLRLDFQFVGKVPAQLKTDATRLRQVLINLIGNAIKFTHDGKVSVTIRHHPEEPHSPIEFKVTDTGVGMSDQTLANLFQPFSQGDSSVTREFGGSGLGLAISSRLVEMLGGEISVESNVERGSTFIAKLPSGWEEGIELIEPSLNMVAAIADSSAADVSLDCKVLVVDDRRDVRYISQHFLEQAGATVETAEDGYQGIVAVRQSEEKNEPFDIVVMDMQMPNLDGKQATAKLRAAGFDQPIIALTADAMKGDREKCLNAGCDDYLTKPLDKRGFVETIAYYVSEKSIDELRQHRWQQAENWKRCGRAV